MTFDEFVGRFERSVVTASGTLVSCPAHEDRRESLHVSQGEGGKILLKCHAGCSAAQVVAAMNLQMKDLFPPKPGRGARGSFNVVAAYDYTNVQGKLLFQVVRLDPKDFRQRHRCEEAVCRLHPKAKPPRDGWCWSIAGIPRVPYRLSDVLKAAEAARGSGGDAVLWVVEGEKDVDRLAALGQVATCNPGGAGKFTVDQAKSLSWPCRVMRTIVVADKDEPGRAHAREVVAKISNAGCGRGLTVVEVPGEAKDVSAFLDAGGTVDELLHLAEQAREDLLATQRRLALEDSEHDVVVEREHDVVDPTAQKPAARSRAVPEIVCTVQVTEMVDEAERVLVASGRPLYQRGGELVRVVDVSAMPRIDVLPRASLLEDLSAVASWVRIRDTKDGEVRVPAMPPREVVDALLARRRWALPELEAVVNRPVLRPDGSVVQAPGYDAGARVLFVPPAVPFPRVPDRPTRDEARAALDELADLFVDFPFVDRCDRSAVLAFVLTLVGRRSIEGPCPLFLVRASTPGTGKSLIVDVVSTLVLGAAAPRMSQGSRRSSEEEEKRLVALGREGAELALIDNVDRPLGSDVLAAALTSRTWRGRLLGQSATAEVTVPVFAASGNNVQVQGDLGRRVVPIDMVAACEQPEEREGFRHPHLLAHVRENRPRLVVAALTVLRWFCAEGRPAADLKPFGSFEAWSGLVRDALVYLGEADPCEGRERIRKAGDPMLEAVRVAWETWAETLGERPHTAAQLVKVASDDLKACLADLDPRLDRLKLDARVLGYVLRSLKDRIVSGYRLESLDPTRGGTPWRVVRADFAPVVVHEEELPFPEAEVDEPGWVREPGDD